MLLLEELPKRHRGATVQQMDYEPCLFIITRKSGGYVSIHVDDCFLSAEDGAWWTRIPRCKFTSHLCVVGDTY